MSNNYDTWRASHGDTQGALQEQDEHRWQAAHEKANSAIESGIDDDDAAMLNEKIDEFFVESMDDEHFKSLSKLLFDVAMNRPVESSSALIEDIRELVLESLTTKFYKENN